MIYIKSLLVLVVLFFLISFQSIAQWDLTGTALNEKEEPAEYINVILKDSVGSTISFTYTNGQGKFSINEIFNGDYYLELNGVSYKKKIINIKIEGESQILNVIMLEDLKVLEEVVVRSNKPIIQKEEVIFFDAKSFTTGEEKVVEDLLKKIPGLTIDSKGTIKVNNQEVEKVMIEGDDLFDKDYKLLTKNMPAYPIEKVELHQRFSENPLLKGIEETDKIALNLTLSEENKSIWFGNVKAALGTDINYDATTNLMKFGKENKYYLLTNINNIGQDAGGDIDNLNNTLKTQESLILGNQTNIDNLISVWSPPSSFEKDRINFNNAKLGSLSTVFNPRDNLKIEFSGVVKGDETLFFQTEIDTVRLKETNFVNKQERDIIDQTLNGKGKVNLIYNISESKLLETRSKYSIGSSYQRNRLVFNERNTTESLKDMDFVIDQNFSYTNKFQENKVILISGKYSESRITQNYGINQFFYQNLFPDLVQVNNVEQSVQKGIRFGGLEAHLLSRELSNNNLLEIFVGNRFKEEELRSSFFLKENDTTVLAPVNHQNTLIHSFNDSYIKAKYRYNLNDFGVIGQLGIHHFYSSIDLSSDSENRQKFVLNPNLGINWKISQNSSLSSTYSYQTNRPEILNIYDGYILDDLRSFSKGNRQINFLDESNILVNYRLGNWSDNFFANAFLLYKKNYDFFSSNSLVQQDFALVNKIIIKDRTFLSFSSELNYYLNFISSNLNLEFGHSSSNYKNIINDSNVRKVNSTSYNYGINLRSAFIRIFNFHIGTNLDFNRIEILNNTNSYIDNKSFIDLSFVFNKKWNLLAEFDQYYFGSLPKRERYYYFLDFSTQYSLIPNKVLFSLTGKNLFNTNYFRNFSINDLGTSTTEFRLLPRYLMFEIAYRF